MRDLVVIPARGGSKGIPGKNIKPLNGKPLIYYAIDLARSFTNDTHICISSDSTEIIEAVEQYGLKVPFVRPPHLATDASGTYEVLLHAINFFEQKEQFFDRLILLQPTSPFREPHQLKEAIALYHSELDMVVSVKLAKANPYYTLFEEDKNGWLQKSKKAKFVTRQECPPVYEVNGALYIININSLKQTPIHQFRRIKKYVMDERTSLDLDTPLDWDFCEFILKENAK